MQRTGCFDFFLCPHHFYLTIQNLHLLCKSVFATFINLLIAVQNNVFFNFYRFFFIFIFLLLLIGLFFLWDVFALFIITNPNFSKTRCLFRLLTTFEEIFRINWLLLWETYSLLSKVEVWSFQIRRNYVWLLFVISTFSFTIFKAFTRWATSKILLIFWLILRMMISWKYFLLCNSTTQIHSIVLLYRSSLSLLGRNYVHSSRYFIESALLTIHEHIEVKLSRAGQPLMTQRLLRVWYVIARLNHKRRLHLCEKTWFVCHKISTIFIMKIDVVQLGPLIQVCYHIIVGGYDVLVQNQLACIVFSIWRLTCSGWLSPPQRITLLLIRFTYSNYWSSSSMWLMVFVVRFY